MGEVDGRRVYRSRKRDYITPTEKRTAVEDHRERYKSFGLVNINAWVPAENKAEILNVLGALRIEHLKRKGYYDDTLD